MSSIQTKPLESPSRKRDHSSLKGEPTPAQTKPLVEAKNLTLTVPIFQPNDRTLRANPFRLLADFYLGRTKRGVITLLNDVSFTIWPGERLGIIGANGAGKSTLLRVLAGIYATSAGKLVVNGEARGLFDISLGMNQEATGLENIFLRGLQMGIPLRDVKLLIPEILDFSGLGDAIHQPLNTFSTGMGLRLALSISTMIEPDILLLDEWLGAGDASFNAKVQKRMDSLVQKSRGLIIATHNETLMKSLCTHGLVLSKGKAIFCGDLDDALEAYRELRA